MSVTWNSSRKRTVVDCARRVVKTGRGSVCGFVIFSRCACLQSVYYMRRKLVYVKHERMEVDSGFIGSEGKAVV
jgi:hypothetical protein